MAHARRARDGLRGSDGHPRRRQLDAGPDAHRRRRVGTREPHPLRSVRAVFAQVDRSKPVRLERRGGADGGVRGLRALSTHSAALTMKTHGIALVATATGLLTTWTAVTLSHLTASEMKAPGLKFAHVVDLTHTLDEDTPYIPVRNITFPFRKTP